MILQNQEKGGSYILRVFQNGESLDYVCIAKLSFRALRSILNKSMDDPFWVPEDVPLLSSEDEDYIYRKLAELES